MDEEIGRLQSAERSADEGLAELAVGGRRNGVNRRSADGGLAEMAFGGRKTGGSSVRRTVRQAQGGEKRQKLLGRGFRSGSRVGRLG